MVNVMEKCRGKEEKIVQKVSSFSPLKVGSSSMCTWMLVNQFFNI